MQAVEFKARTRQFALTVIKVVESLPAGPVARVIGQQLLRCGTSVGANYRAACRARSQAEFIAKMGIVEEECDESIYWMELLVESGLVPQTTLSPTMNEAQAILSMTVASIRTARNNQQPAKRQK